MVDDYKGKLGPQLLEQVETKTTDPAEEIVVLIGLNIAATPEMLAELQKRGLSVRSTIGDVLTGSVPLNRLQELSGHENILKIDASGPVYLEGGEGGPALDVE